ncbi:MAG: protein-disulfide reductase DsbD domain-containing protein, partial [Pseudolabrys sp.]
DDTRSSMRLIAGAPPHSELRAGIEIKLQTGWKTYWRSPGDSGVPPRFDFTGSDNLASARVQYPAPHALTDETGTSIGYKGGVIFPVRIIPRDPSKPVMLKVTAEYAVCEKLCVPAEGRAELSLANSTGAQDAALAGAQAQVPVPVSADEAGLKARRATATLKPLVILDVAAPKAGAYQVFVEGPNAEWALPIPKGALGAPGGRRHFEFELDGIPPGVDPMGPFELTFTVIGGDKPIEVTTHLD